MKVIRLLLLALMLAAGCAVLMQMTSYAASSLQTSTQNSAGQDGDRAHDAEHRGPAENVRHEKEGKLPDEPRVYSPYPAKNHPRSLAHLTTSSRTKQLPNTRKHSPGKAANLYPTFSDRSGGARNGGRIQNQAANNIPAVRPTSTAHPTGALLESSLNAGRHRGLNAAVIGGTKNTNRNTGAINGTRMNHRP